MELPDRTETPTFLVHIVSRHMPQRVRRRVPFIPQDSPYPQKSVVHCVTCDALLGEKVAHRALLRATEQVVLEHVLPEWEDQCFLLFQHLNQSLKVCKCASGWEGRPA